MKSTGCSLCVTILSMKFENVFYDHFTYIFLAVIRITTVGLELSRFCFCRLNILEVTGKAQANAEESNLGLYNNAPQVFTGHKKNES